MKRARILVVVLITVLAGLSLPIALAAAGGALLLDLVVACAVRVFAGTRDRRVPSPPGEAM